jgi:hypothetical protein
MRVLYKQMFTEPSKRIQEFVKNELNIMSAFHLSKRSKAFLKNIHNLMVAAPPPNYKIISQKHCLPNTPFPKGRMFDEIEIPTIQTHIINLSKSATEIELIVGGRTYHLYFVLPLGSSIKIDECVKKMNMLLNFATRFASSDCSMHVNVYLYLTNADKRLPNADKRLPNALCQPIDKEHVNTAFTTGCNTTTEITIFRREEWFKVFIHESMHNLGLDFDFSTKNQQLLKSIFPLKNSKCFLGETYCEMWAEILNILLHHDGSAMERHIQIERKFSLFQTAKILDYFDLNYVELYEKTKESERLRQNNYKESTAVFCYYIVKTILLYNCNEFIEWVETNCNGGIKFDQQHVEKFIRELIIPTYNQIKLVKTIDKVQTKHFDKPVTDIFLKNTLRMSAIEYLL